MSYPPPYPQPSSPRRRVLGIIVLFVTLVVTGMFILTGYAIVAATFTGFQPIVNQLPVNAQNIISQLKSNVNNSYLIAVMLIIVSAVAGVIFAIFSLASPEPQPMPEPY